MLLTWEIKGLEVVMQIRLDRLEQYLVCTSFLLSMIYLNHVVFKDLFIKIKPVGLSRSKDKVTQGHLVVFPDPQYLQNKWL